MIYFARSLLSDSIKIGYSENPERRVKDFAIGADVIATIEGDRDKECALHERFKSLRIVGSEWFENREPLTSYVESLQGEPSGDVAMAINKVWKMVLSMGFLFLLTGCQSNPLWFIGIVASILLIVIIVCAAVASQPLVETEPPKRLVFTDWLTDEESGGAGLVGLIGDPDEVVVAKRYHDGREYTIERRGSPYMIYNVNSGMIFNVRTNETQSMPELRKVESVRRVLQAANSWPRLTEPEEPLVALENVESDWLPIWEENHDE